jgi:hypothetical protein
MNPDEHGHDEAIRSLMENLPMSNTAPESLKARLLDLGEPRRRPQRRFAGALVALAASMTTVVAAVVFITSVPASAKSWDGIKRAAASIRAMDLTVTDARSNEIKSRVHLDPTSIQVQLSTGDYMIVSDGLVRTFDKSDNLVFDVILPGNGQGPDVRSLVLQELSMSSILAQYEREYGTKNMSIGAVHDWQDRRVYDVTLRDPNSPARGNLVVDAESDLPIFLEVFESQNGIVGKTMEMTARFNDEAASAILGTELRKGARHETIAVEKLMEKNGGKLPRLNFSFKRLLRD